MRGWYDVTDYGAKGDGGRPDHTAIQAAVDAAANHGGGVVWLPPGTYRLRGAVTVAPSVQFVGAGWSTTWAPGRPNPGTWLLVDRAGFSAVTVTGPGATVRDVAFMYDQPPPGPGWEPRDYPPAVHVAASDVLVQNVHLYNATRGILIHHAKGAIGRVTLDRVWGQPLAEGIAVDNALDVIKVHNVHLWPFWSEIFDKPAGDAVREYQARAGVAVRCGRVDNPQFSHVFAFGYSRGFLFGTGFTPGGRGVTSRFFVTNADLDHCPTGIEVTGEHTTGQFVNLSAFGGPAGVCGIVLSAPSARIQAANVRLASFTTNAVRANHHCSVHLSNLWVQDWNLGQTVRRFPAVEAAGRSTVHLGRPVFFEQSPGVLAAPATGGTGTVIGDS
jgi:hypothetical protein